MFTAGKPSTELLLACVDTDLSVSVRATDSTYQASFRNHPPLAGTVPVGWATIDQLVADRARSKENAVLGSPALLQLRMATIRNSIPGRVCGRDRVTGFPREFEWSSGHLHGVRNLWSVSLLAALKHQLLGICPHLALTSVSFDLADPEAGELAERLADMLAIRLAPRGRN